MDTIFPKMNKLSLRQKLNLIYTVVFLVLLGVSLGAVYFITENNRRDEFYQRLKDKTITTFNLLIEVEQINHDLFQKFDRHDNNILHDEKLILFDERGKVFYTSLDDTKILYSNEVLNSLEKGKIEIETTEGEYELVGIRFKHDNKVYYGIIKAFDRFGKNKIWFLKWLLIITFIIVGCLMVFLSNYVSKIITFPIRKLTREIEQITPSNLSIRVNEPLVKDEVGFLASKFNELLGKVESAFKFQYHFIHHLSHELKTPLAVMMTNTERALSDGNAESYKNSLTFQQNAMMELANIINAMLDISKMETKLESVMKENIRMDELLFECMDELRFLDEKTRFDFSLDDNIQDSETLTISGNSRMLKLALINLLKNCVYYSEYNHPIVQLLYENNQLKLRFINKGATITKDEQTQLFLHLFRGKNAEKTKGFGLGLVLVQRIATLHNATIEYLVLKERENCFDLSFMPYT